MQEGGAGPGFRPPGDGADIAADRHRQKTLVWSSKVAGQGEFRVTTSCRTGAVVAEERVWAQAVALCVAGSFDVGVLRRSLMSW